MDSAVRQRGLEFLVHCINYTNRQSLKLSDSHFLHLQNEDVSSIYFTVLLWEFNINLYISLATINSSY